MDLQEYIDKRKAFFTRRTTADYQLTGDDIIRGRKPEEKKSISTLTLKDIKARHTNKNNITIRYVEVPNAKLRTEFVSMKKALELKQDKE